MGGENFEDNSWILERLLLELKSSCCPPSYPRSKLGDRWPELKQERHVGVKTAILATPQRCPSSSDRPIPFLLEHSVLHQQPRPHGPVAEGCPLLFPWQLHCGHPVGLRMFGALVLPVHARRKNFTLALQVGLCL